MVLSRGGALRGSWEPSPLVHWPGWGPVGVAAGTGVPSSDSPSGQRQVATSTPLIFPARTQEKLKQFANCVPTPRSSGHTKYGASLFFFPLFQSLMACGMFPSGEYSDQTPLFGGSQLPCILPPLGSAIDGPEKIGQVHWAAGKSAVPPPAVLTAIVPPVGVHVEAAQSAKSPRQNRKSCWKLCALTCGVASSTTPLRIKRTRLYRNMSSSFLTFSELTLQRHLYLT